MESKCWNLLPWGMETNVGDFYRGLQLKEHKVTALDTVYEQSRIKASHIHYRANELLCSFVNGEGKNVQITFRVSNNDVAFRYTLPREQGKGSVTVNSERTGFRFRRRHHFPLSAERRHDRVEAYQTQLRRRI